jgi:ABC-type nitrate/sulfonate/bicarbonate transport system permease component
MATNPIQQPISISCRVFLEKTGRFLFAFAQTTVRVVPSLILGAAGLGIVLLVWWLISLGVDRLRLPSPWIVIMAIPVNWSDIPALQYVALQSGGLADALAYTVTNVLVTVAIGSLAGVLVGIALPLLSTLRLLVSPALIVLGSTPVLILLPFLVEWFGNGGLVRSGIVVIFSFVVVSTVCMRASQEAAGRYRNYALSLGARPAFEMRHVILPALLPDLIAGLRVSLAAAWSMESVAEVIGGQKGAGRVIATMAHLSNTEILLAMVVCLSLAAVVLDGTLAAVGRGLLTWKE